MQTQKVKTKKVRGCSWFHPKATHRRHHEKVASYRLPPSGPPCLLKGYQRGPSLLQESQTFFELILQIQQYDTVFAVVVKKYTSIIVQVFCK